MVVGTPGRLLDHVGRGTLQLSDAEFLILDEADQMLDMGFKEEMEKVHTFIHMSHRRGQERTGEEREREPKKEAVVCCICVRVVCCLCV